MNGQVGVAELRADVSTNKQIYWGVATYQPLAINYELFKTMYVLLSTYLFFFNRPLRIYYQF